MGREHEVMEVIRALGPEQAMSARMLRNQFPEMTDGDLWEILQGLQCSGLVDLKRLGTWQLSESTLTNLYVRARPA